MPTYDYKCNACEHTFELFQQMSDAIKRKCPRCGKPKLERLIGTGAGVLFKGGGFYETDYRSESYTKAAEAEKKSVEGKADADKKPTESTAASSTGEGKAKSEGASSSTGESSSSVGGDAKKGERPRVAKSAAAPKSGKPTQRK